MLGRNVWLAGLLAIGSHAQSSDSSSSSGSASSGSSSTSPSVVTLTGTTSSPDFTGSQYTYASLGSQITASTRYASTSGSSSSSRSGSASSTSTCSGSSCSSTGSRTTDSSTITSTSKGSTSVVSLLVGGGGIVTESIINGTVTLSSHLNTTTTSRSATGTSSSATPTNTQPCNGYPEFCSRSYGNITEVCAHNSAFDNKNNAAANQVYGIEQQLNDGIRMIQGETHWVNNTIYNCHTSCSLLNAGTWLSSLQTIASWVESHPYDVVTILIVNSDFVDVGNYTGPLQESGLGPYLYEPPYIPMRLDQWPTLSEMILTQKRVVVFMDYMANQQDVPYILDEFTHMWETPFSPTNISFPCTTQRPPNLNQTVARDELMYLANHNLNTEISLLGTSLLVPNTASINITNAAEDQIQMLGATANNCTADWGRPPNWLLVDYYNIGNGSVFEVAAKMNGVTYNQKCCGTTTSGASDLKGPAFALAAVVVAAIAFVM